METKEARSLSTNTTNFASWVIARLYFFLHNLSLLGCWNVSPRVLGAPTVVDSTPYHRYATTYSKEQSWDVVKGVRYIFVINIVFYDYCIGERLGVIILGTLFFFSRAKLTPAMHPTYHAPYSAPKLTLISYTRPAPSLPPPTSTQPTST